MPTEGELGHLWIAAQSHMLDGLSLEAAAIRKNDGKIQIELRGGERVGEAESYS